MLVQTLQALDINQDGNQTEVDTDNQETDKKVNHNGNTLITQWKKEKNQV